jgi:hypothetical protein
MIESLLEEFILHIQVTPELLNETAFAAMMGNHENYFQTKFGYFLQRKLCLKYELGDFSIAFESYDTNDMVIRIEDVVHFIEWKAMTLPFITTKKAKEELKDKQCDNLVQLAWTNKKFQFEKTRNRKNKLKAKFWSAIAFIDFNESYYKEFSPQYDIQKKELDLLYVSGKIQNTSYGLKQTSPTEIDLMLDFKPCKKLILRKGCDGNVQLRIGFNIQEFTRVVKYSNWNVIGFGVLGKSGHVGKFTTAAPSVKYVKNRNKVMEKTLKTIAAQYTP